MGNYSRATTKLWDWAPGTAPEPGSTVPFTREEGAERVRQGKVDAKGRTIGSGGSGGGGGAKDSNLKKRSGKTTPMVAKHQLEKQTSRDTVKRGSQAKIKHDSSTHSRNAAAATERGGTATAARKVVEVSIDEDEDWLADEYAGLEDYGTESEGDDEGEEEFSRVTSSAEEEARGGSKSGEL